jgi:dTDP-4-amino-4,6-dideoxygalactose transaminase
MIPQRVFLSPPHLGGEEEYFVREAFNSNYIAPLGPQVDAFEKEFCELTGAGHAVALTSGTAAIHIALRMLGVSPGDEVFASTLTFIGSVSPVTFQNAVPVFIDCDRQSWNMEPDLLEMELERCAANGKLPKAVIPTDLYGQCVDMARIIEICDWYEVPVVCDSAEALGAKYKQKARYGGRCGEIKQNSELETLNKSVEYSMLRDDFVHAGVGAQAAVFSFNGNKIITTSGGGMLVSDDGDFIEKARFLSQQARDPFPHYEHSEIGYNYRMSNIVAAVGRGQLRVLDMRIARKRKICDYYKGALGDLPGVEFMPEASYGRCTRWLTVVLITPEEFGADREVVRLALEEENIESRPVWKPMHLQPVFNVTERLVPSAEGRSRSAESKDTGTNAGKKRYPCRAVGGTVAEDLFERGLCLPSGTVMSEGDLDRVVGVIRGCCR